MIFSQILELCRADGCAAERDGTLATIVARTTFRFYVIFVVGVEGAPHAVELDGFGSIDGEIGIALEMGIATVVVPEPES